MKFMAEHGLGTLKFFKKPITFSPKEKETNNILQQTFFGGSFFSLLRFGAILGGL